MIELAARLGILLFGHLCIDVSAQPILQPPILPPSQIAFTPHIPLARAHCRLCVYRRCHELCLFSDAGDSSGWFATVVNAGPELSFVLIIWV
jgi:hypothetical protein